MVTNENQNFPKYLKVIQRVKQCQENTPTNIQDIKGEGGNLII